MDRSDVNHESEQSGDEPLIAFKLLGRNIEDAEDVDIYAQTHNEIDWTARKACAALKVTSTILNAIIVHPGCDASDEEIAAATRELMHRAMHLTNAAVVVLDAKMAPKAMAGYKNLLRQQAADVVAMQWRLAHTSEGKPIDPDRIIEVFKNIVSLDAVEADGELNSYPQGIDPVSARRMALLAAAPGIHQAVMSFDFFVPDPQVLVEHGVQKVIDATETALKKIISKDIEGQAAILVMQSLIAKLGGLYETNYRAQARKNVSYLMQMVPSERADFIDRHRAKGLPMQHIDRSYERLCDRLVEMVCEAVPEVPLVMASGIELKIGKPGAGMSFNN